MDDEDRRRNDDWRDHQAEVAGIENGRASRFLDGENSPRNRNVSERKARERAFQTQLELLMMSPAYAAAYNRVNDLIDEAQTKLTDAVDKVAARIEHLEDVLADMEERTAKLPDGTAVFRAADGTLISADGSPLSKADTALLLNPENLLSYEQYEGAKGALQSARSQQDKLSGIQPKLDDARDRLDKTETVDEIDGIEADIQKAITEIEAATSAKAEFNAVAAEPIEKALVELDLTLSSSAP